MILGIGTDIVEIERIAASVERAGERFVKRILTPAEQTQFYAFANPDKAIAFLAKRFAAKEAAVKAMGTGIGSGVSFQHFTVANLASGQPILQVDQQVQDLIQRSVEWHLSLSDERRYALAFVTLEAKG